MKHITFVAAVLILSCTACSQTLRDVTEAVEKSIRIDVFFEQGPEMWSGYVPEITPVHDSTSHVVTLQEEHTHGTPQGLLFRVRNRAEPRPVGEKPPSAWPMTIRSRFRPIEDWREFNQFTCWVWMEGARSQQIGISFVPKEKVFGGGKWNSIAALRTVTAGKWYKFTLRFDPHEKEKRTDLRQIKIYTQRFGVEPGWKSDHVSFYLDDFRLSKVPERKWKGWEPDPLVITINQVGYKTFFPKQAVVNPSVAGAGDAFVIRDVETGKTVFQGQLAMQRSGRCEYLVADFSALDKPGYYRVHSGRLLSARLRIDENPFAFLLPLQLDWLAASRCGCATAFHGPCHLDDLIYKGNHYSCPGGYHDACDLRRFMQNPNIVGGVCANALEDDGLSGELRERFLDEALWAHEAHYKCLKHLGVIPHAVSENTKSPNANIWSDNKVGTLDDRTVGDDTPRPTDVHLESLKVAAQLAYLLKQRGDPRQKEILERALWQWKKFQDPEYWKRSNIPGWQSLDTNWVSLGLKSQIGLYLYLATGEERFKRQAVEQAEKLLDTQTTSFYTDSSEPVTGNFITGYGYHRTIWQASRAVAALADLCAHLPDHADFMKWYFALKINGEFYAKPSSRLQEPYGLGLLNMRGRSLGGKIRWIAHGGGITEANLNQAYGRLRMARVLDDTEIERIATKQLGWGMGENPFAISALYEIGEDYIEDPAAYAGLTKGAPCPGVSCMVGDKKVSSGDTPMFTRNNYCTGYAASREMWVPLSSRYAQLLAAISSKALLCGRVHSGGEPWRGRLAIHCPDGKEAAFCQTNDKGEFGPISLAGGIDYTLRVGSTERDLSLVSGRKLRLDIDLDRLWRAEADGPTVIGSGEFSQISLKLRSLSRTDQRIRFKAFGWNVDSETDTQEIALPAVSEAQMVWRLKGHEAGQPFVTIFVPNGTWQDRVEVFGEVR